MKELKPEQIEDIRHIIDTGDKDAATQELADMHPAEIAELYQELDEEQGETLFNMLEGDTAADVLMELDEEDRKRILSDMSPEDIATNIIDHLDTDEAVDLIQEMDEEERDEILSHIDDVEQAGDIIDLLKYDEDTAGGLMGKEMIVVNENWSMPECIKEMRMQAEDVDEIYYVYVVDNEQRLKGTLPLKELITHPSVSKIKHVMETDPKSVKTDTPIDEVALDFEKYDLVAMPVIDSIGRLVGRITVDDIMDQVRESSERDYQLASGISSDIDADDSIFAQVKARIPWLLIGIASGILASIILSTFETQLAAVTTLALFIPIIGGTGGNVGVQASAIVVQSLANGSLEIKQFAGQLGKEVLIGLLNATIISGVIFVYNLVMLPGEFAVTLSVAMSLFIVVMFATMLGTVVPLTLEKLHINPALATGPFIQISNDILGLIIYVWISTYCLKIFGA
ncbi:MAG: magnesium transporter [Muribaculaceae bacterium]|nr:magnesium transporter [Muribaculaceae bacterium]MDE6643126.1 magnesium transporter [Muribaculaceae bacterium]